ncbi:BTB/POZ domain-containing protein At5g48800 [Physcomitrium patens]|uniref:Uncharacterized protein n=1 Tax=Physcomitrium patens TaxID=3218 RepID=A0A2K1KX36_PHYPA|nr:BTB/POZ domain-containing protein At5g48800-like [Physcomitrium patens]XP_024371414.1 BTB/POZ domain-containing protein At5g48800-like [Physcomitrium patens]PNR58354.1 hypothetical protein PHYPA_005349 [Physcomitrium patens]|eukprot:XP_024371413.1 BTB/POZ domain-containing protein At5g48800-like [Physcomitrella patens]
MFKEMAVDTMASVEVPAFGRRSMSVEMPGKPARRSMSVEQPYVPARRSMSIEVPNSKRLSRPSLILKRSTTEWRVSTDAPADIVVEVGGQSFALHKFPLVARSGKIRRLVASEKADENGILHLQLPDLPGGSEAFDLAAKFCYGINYDITTYNVALLRCAADYLEMNEQWGDNNLVERTEKFLNEFVLQNLAESIAVLHNCESLLPLAEDLKLVNRCIQAAAIKAVRDQAGDYEGSSHLDNVKVSHNDTPTAPVVEWWAEDLAVLRFDFFQKVLAQMRTRGMRCESLGGAVMHYAHRALKGIHKRQIMKSPKPQIHSPALSLEHEQRILVEAIVSIMPPERNAISCSFLFGLLRAAVVLECTLACRLDLERRIGLQLEQATLDDLLIPSVNHSGETLFDVDAVQRILNCFMQQDGDGEVDHTDPMYEAEGVGSPTQSALIKVAKLLDTYLAEIAPDANLTISKFMALAEVLPEHARRVDDGLYRAVDVFLKAHPAIIEAERKTLCKIIDCQKLSQDACTHAAQNERLPVQVVVQVLYFEQLRLRNAMSTINTRDPVLRLQLSQRMTVGNVATGQPPNENYESVRRENRDLKLEIARMRMRMTELERDQNNLKVDIVKNGGGSRFIDSMSKKLSKLNPFQRRESRDFKNSGELGTNSSGTPLTPDTRSAKPRRRRHSVS